MTYHDAQGNERDDRIIVAYDFDDNRLLPGPPLPAALGAMAKLPNELFPPVLTP